MHCPLRTSIRTKILLSLLLTASLIVGPGLARAEHGEDQLGVFRFAFICDSHTGYGPGNRNLAKAAMLLKTLAPAFVIAGGDLTERGLPGEYAVFDEALKPVKPVYEVPGNHDTRWKGAPVFRSFYGATYRSFDYGGYHFVLLDTSVEGQPDAVLSRAQIRWLEQDLARISPESPVIVFSHHPLGDGGVENEAAALVLLGRRSTACYVSGHGHTAFLSSVGSVPSVHDAGVLEGFMLLFEVRGGTAGISSVELDTGAIRPLTSLAGAAFPDPLVAGASTRGDKILVSVNARSNERVAVKIGGGQWIDAGQGATYAEVATEGLEPGVHPVKVETRHDGRILRSASTSVTIAGPGAATAWQVDLGDSVLWPVASDVRTTYIAGESGFLYALDKATGRVCWKANVGSTPSGGPALAGNLILCPTSRGYVVALEKLEGTFVWATLGPEPPYGTPVVSGSRAFIPCGTGVTALDSVTGKRLWSYDTGAQTGTALTVAGGRIFVGAYDGRLLCLSESGTLVWQQVVESSFYYAPVFSPPTVSGGIVAVTTQLYTKGTGHTLHAFRVADGGKAWSVNVGTALSAPIPVGDGFLTPTAVGKAVLVREGTNAGATVFPRYYGGVSCSSQGAVQAIGKQVAYGVDSRGYVFEVSWTGGAIESRSLYSLGANCYTTPILAGQDLITVDFAGRITRLRLSD